MRVIFVVMSVCFLLWGNSFAQTVQSQRPTTPAQPNLQSSAVSAQSPQGSSQGSPFPAVQWEYIVVSYGKALFGIPEKTFAYSTLSSDVVGQEAKGLQRSLDVLGRFGWEIVTVVGSVGGDQQVVLKRRYEKDRTSSEAAKISRMRELYLNELVDILEREEKIRSTRKEDAADQLVELDEVDRLALVAKDVEKIREVVVDVLSDLKFADKSKFNVNALYSGSEDISVEIEIDYTSDLLIEGNKYRRSTAKAFAERSLQRFRSMVEPVLLRQLVKSRDLNVKISANLQYKSKRNIVFEQSTRYSQILKRWD